MRVSTIIPVYNAEKTIYAALESVLKQTYNGNIEVVVVNDGSTDRSQQVVEDFMRKNRELKIILINQSNKGVSAARNRGINESSGNLIAFLDADDVWLPDKLSVQTDFLKENPSIAFVAALRTSQKIKWPYTVKNNVVDVTLRKLLLRNEIITPAVVMRRQVINSSGLFDEAQHFAEDHGYWLQIARHEKMVILNRALVTTGGGKRSFGVSGLSANLGGMEKGFQNNLCKLHEQKVISKNQYLFMRGFYSVKYIIRRLRHQFYKFIGR